MKLNYRRTILVGFAFFLISAFWQAYDNAIPLTLTNKFGMPQMWSGVIMALDNILAVVLLPIFGALSDRCHSKRGRRTPFIMVGTILAAVSLVLLSFADNAQLKKLSAVEDLEDPAALTVIYEAQKDAVLKTPDGTEFVLAQEYTLEEFTALEIKDSQGNVTHAYTDHVAPARQAYTHQLTTADPAVLLVFVGLLLMVLLSMAVFRSPAVALMPDVTLKPLRSKANAIINLMGTAGGILVLVLGKVFATSSVDNALMSYTGFFGVVVLVMLLALAIFRLTVKERLWASEMQTASIKYGIDEEEPEDKGKKCKLSWAERRSLLLILLSVALWYMGYNAVTSKYSVYASEVLHKEYNTTMLIAQVAAIISYLPVGMIASRVGRRKTILAGVLMLTGAFTGAAFMGTESPDTLIYALFALAGIAWATINVNSFPMVVEMCAGGNVGRYTGFYYTASMAAQVITPILSGWLMDTTAKTALFPYAAVFVGLAFVTMYFVRHGDSKPQAKKGLEALDVDD